MHIIFTKKDKNEIKKGKILFLLYVFKKEICYGEGIFCKVPNLELRTENSEQYSVFVIECDYRIDLDQSINKQPNNMNFRVNKTCPFGEYCLAKNCIYQATITA